ncbi:E3 ubiquitin/ISG15 ligase TRIM25-like [Aulostomus maculatus]
MEQRQTQLYTDAISCTICRGIFKNPVTIPCGHSFCLSCLENSWKQGRSVSCPQCWHSFRSRPVLAKNTMLTNLVEQLQKSGFHKAPSEHSYAGPLDVACDVCTGRRLKACKYCLFCLIAFCDKHLKPHFQASAFEKHTLVDPCEKHHEKTGSPSEDGLKMVENPDRPGLDIMVERRQKEHNLLKKRIEERKTYIKKLQHEVTAINLSADQAVEKSEKNFTDLIHAIKRRRADVKQRIKAKQYAELRRIREVRKKVRKEILEMTKDEGMKHQGPTGPHIQNTPLHYFDDVKAAASNTLSSVENVLMDWGFHITQTLSQTEFLLSQPRTREEFLQYSRPITLDPNTAHAQLFLSEGNRAAKFMAEEQAYSPHPDRFGHHPQVLSRESMTGRCYWEVEWTGAAGTMAVSYKDIGRAGKGLDCGLGQNGTSWALTCDNQSFKVLYNNYVVAMATGPVSHRIGVYLDQYAGELAFFNIRDNQQMDLLYRTEANFTQPPHAGFHFRNVGDTVELINTKTQ